MQITRERDLYYYAFYIQDGQRIFSTRHIENLIFNHAGFYIKTKNLPRKWTIRGLERHAWVGGSSVFLYREKRRESPGLVKIPGKDYFYIALHTFIRDRQVTFEEIWDPQLPWLFISLKRNMIIWFERHAWIEEKNLYRLVILSPW